jgi:exopolyphosphatase/guanosine-5'-triphosphate,3'-diphosphate pyrophosphatase
LRARGRRNWPAEAGRAGRPSGRRRRRPSLPAYGAVDLGTNNCRLLVAEPRGRDFQVVDSFSRIVRLGEGLAATGVLCESAIARTIAALKVCRDVMGRNGVAAARCVATEACRRAANGASFVGRVKDELGLVLEPITSEEEARLTLAGCGPLLDCGLPRALVFDIGGGSTEVTWVEQAAGRPPRALATVSLPFGVVTLAERHACERVSPAAYGEIVDDVDAALAPFDRDNGIGGRVRERAVFMLGTSGTVTTLGALSLGLRRYDRSRVDGITIAFDAVAAINRRLAGMDREALARHPCIGRERADLVVMGCAVLEGVCRRWPVGRLRVADRGVREGLLLAMMGGDSAPAAPEGWAAPAGPP